MLKFFKLSMLSACLVNTIAFASGYPKNHIPEDATFISVPLQLNDSMRDLPLGGVYDFYLVDDASTKEWDAWSGFYRRGDLIPPRRYFREPEAKILQKEWDVLDGTQPADWVGESYIAIVYQAYASEDPSDKTRVHNGNDTLLKTLVLTYEGNVEVNLDEWFPVNEPGRVGWAKRTANGVKALTNLRLFIKPPTKG